MVVSGRHVSPKLVLVLSGELLQSELVLKLLVLGWERF